MRRRARSEIAGAGPILPAPGALVSMGVLETVLRTATATASRECLVLDEEVHNCFHDLTTLLMYRYPYKSSPYEKTFQRYQNHRYHSTGTKFPDSRMNRIFLPALHESPYHNRHLTFAFALIQLAMTYLPEHGSSYPIIISPALLACLYHRTTVWEFPGLSAYSRPQNSTSISLATISFA